MCVGSLTVGTWSSSQRRPDSEFETDTSDGVFVADQKVADLGQVVETIARTDVVEIRSSGRTLSPVQKGALIGAIAGVATGRTFASLLCEGGPCYTSGYVWEAALFGGSGAGIGALIGAARHK